MLNWQVRRLSGYVSAWTSGNGYDLRFEIENSTQNELGKEHVSAFLWCFTKMGCIR